VESQETKLGGQHFLHFAVSAEIARWQIPIFYLNVWWYMCLFFSHEWTRIESRKFGTRKHENNEKHERWIIRSAEM